MPIKQGGNKPKKKYHCKICGRPVYLVPGTTLTWEHVEGDKRTGTPHPAWPKEPGPYR